VSDDAEEDGALPAQWQDSQNATAFVCAALPPATRFRITLTAKTAYRSVDAQGLERSQDWGTDSAVYRVEPLEASNPPSVRIVLEALTLGSPGSQSPSMESAWPMAVERGWVAVGGSFTIERSSAGWCWFGTNGCDASNPEKDEFAAAVGLQVELLDQTPQLFPSLDGMASDGTLAVTLPSKVSYRLSLGEDVIAQATRPGYPASFVVTHPERRSTATGGTAIEEWRKLSLEAEAALVVDANCRVVELRRVERSRLSFFGDELPSAGIISTLSWQYSPVGG
jgi:hypothetical protein